MKVSSSPDNASGKDGQKLEQAQKLLDQEQISKQKSRSRK